MKKEYVVIETEHRKIGRSNTDNTSSNQAIIFPTFGSTRRKGSQPNPEEKECQGQILDARRRHAEVAHKNREVDSENTPPPQNAQ